MDDDPIRRKPPELADQAYGEQLRRASVPVAEAFERLKVRTASSLEISDLSHEFHQGPSRKPRGTYRALKPDALAARAVALGVLAKESLPPGVAVSLAQRIEAFEHLAREERQVRTREPGWARVHTKVTRCHRVSISPPRAGRTEGSHESLKEMRWLVPFRYLPAIAGITPKRDAHRSRATVAPLQASGSVRPRIATRQ